MATVFIQKRKRKKRNSYVVYYKDPATLRLKYFKTFQRQKDANQAAHTLRTLIDTGQTPDIKKIKVKLNFLTFDKVACSLKEEWTQRLEKRKSLAQKTFNEYSIRLNVLKRIFGKKLVYTADTPRDFSGCTSSIKSSSSYSVYLSNRGFFTRSFKPTASVFIRNLDCTIVFLMYVQVISAQLQQRNTTLRCGCQMENFEKLVRIPIVPTINLEDLR